MLNREKNLMHQRGKTQAKIKGRPKASSKQGICAKLLNYIFGAPKMFVKSALKLLDHNIPFKSEIHFEILWHRARRLGLLRKETRLGELMTGGSDRAEAVSVGTVGTRGCQNARDGSFGQRKEMENIACFKGILRFCMWRWGMWEGEGEWAGDPWGGEAAWGSPWMLTSPSKLAAQDGEQSREPEDCLFSRPSVRKCRPNIHATLIQEFICLKCNHELDPSYKSISDMDLERGPLTACLEEGHVPLVNRESHSSPKGASHNSVLALLIFFFWL